MNLGFIEVPLKKGFWMTKEEFYQNCREWVKKDKSTWNHLTLVAYFVVKYEGKYGIKYKMARWADNPAKTKASRDMSKLVKSFKETDPDKDNKFIIMKAYNYINWIFDFKFRQGNTVNSTGLLLTHTLINEFEKTFAKKMRQYEEKKNSFTIQSWIEENCPDIKGHYQLNDKNDIDIFIRFCESSDLSEDMSEYKLYKKLKERY
jgi:hypothetical protein